MPVTRLISCCFVILHFFATAAHAAGQVPANRLATLAHGINITRWFTNPPAPEFYEHYISPEVFRQLRDVGFTYLRVPLPPSGFQGADGNLNRGTVKLLVEQLAMAEQAGLGVMVQPQRQQGKLKDGHPDRDFFLAFLGHTA